MIQPSILSCLFLGFIISLLVGCGEQKRAGGGIWDQTENGVALTVKDPAGNPVANARVRLVSFASWSSEVLAGKTPSIDSALTDKNGQALVHTTSWPVNLEIESPMGMKREEIFGADSAHATTVETPSELSGTVAITSSQAPSEVRLAGSTFRTPLSAQGKFSFVKIPAGTYSLVAIYPSSLSLLTSVTTQHGDSIKLGTLALPDTSSILLDDFEDGNDANRYHEFTGEGWWYTATDSISQVIPSKISTAIVTGTEAWQGGHSLHESLAVNLNVTGKYALCGMDIEAGVQSSNKTFIAHNLVTVDSITFMAKGSGTINLQWYSTFNASVGYANRIVAHFDLSPTWTQVSLKPQDFAPEPQDSTFTWNNIAAQTSGFAFNATLPASLWLDNIILHGISESQLFPQLRKP